MLFTHLGRAIAIIVLVLGILQIALGFVIAEEAFGPYKDALVRYGVKSSGQIIDRGIYATLAAVAFGVLTEISYALRAIANKI